MAGRHDARSQKHNSCITVLVLLKYWSMVLTTGSGRTAEKRQRRCYYPAVIVVLSYEYLPRKLLYGYLRLPIVTLRLPAVTGN